jgi:hypothetical protein
MVIDRVQLWVVVNTSMNHEKRAISLSPGKLLIS